MFILTLYHTGISYLFDLSQLLPAAPYVVISNLVECFLLILSLDWLSLAVDHSVGGNNAVGGGVSLNNLGGGGLYYAIPQSLLNSEINLATITTRYTHMFNDLYLTFILRTGTPIQIIISVVVEHYMIWTRKFHEKID